MRERREVVIVTRQVCYSGWIKSEMEWMVGIVFEFLGPTEEGSRRVEVRCEFCYACEFSCLAYVELFLLDPFLVSGMKCCGNQLTSTNIPSFNLTTNIFQLTFAYGFHQII